MRGVAGACGAALGALLSWGAPALAFSHIVKPGETLSQIAARVYGDARKETVLAGANALDVQGGSAIVPGMRLEIPSPGHHTVIAGDTWNALALTWLGDTRRADVLARLNHTVAWVDPPVGLAVEIPAVIAHIAADGESSASIAARYWGDSNRGWELNAFNGRREVPLQRGEIVLVWLPDLVLSDAGRGEARQSKARVESETETARLDVQRRADAELPLLTDDVAKGRYVGAVARANRILGSGPLTRPELAIVHRALLEAYVALGAEEEAVAACTAWRANDPGAHLDPVLTSPKVRAWCSF
jgi:LysM repeat protein